MFVQSDVHVRIDYVDNRVDASQMAQIAFAFGYDMELLKTRSEQGVYNHSIILRRGNLAPIADDLVRLVYLSALAHNRGIDDTLAEIKKKFAALHVRTDQSLEDLPGIGEMHHGGHGEDES